MHWWRWGNTMESESAFHVTEKLTDNSFMGIALGGSYRSVPVHVSEIPGRSLESWKATSAGDCIPVKGNNKLVLHAFMDGVLWSGFLEVKDQNGTVIKRLNMSDLPEVSAPVYTGKQSVKAPRDMGGNKFCINEEIAPAPGHHGSTDRADDARHGKCVGRHQYRRGKPYPAVRKNIWHVSMRISQTDMWYPPSQPMAEAIMQAAS